MKCSPLGKIALGFVALSVTVFVAWAQQQTATDIGQFDKKSAAKAFKKPYSPYAGRAYPTRPLFGDTHLHTSFSMDAGAFGCRLGPKDAYRFAKGEEVVASMGERVRLSRPLDFLVVTDHSDGMGFFPRLLGGDPAILADAQGRKWYNLIREGQGAEAAQDIIVNFSQGTMSKALLSDMQPTGASYRQTWLDIIAAAEEANQPGRFTAFIGYEWTSNTGGNNLHRNVIFRDNGLKAGRVTPLTTQKPLGSDNPRDLWKWMAAYEEKTGGNVLAIAHNGNLSNGRMFPIIESFTGKPVDREYAEQRSRWERLFEATQIKGDGETHPFLSKNDEFAAFERWDRCNLDGSVAKKPEMFEFEYARAALKNGLKLEKELGINPYKFGMIGSTDSHTALSTADQDNFFGKTSSSEPSPDRWEHPFIKSAAATIFGWETVASGYAGVWATDNTREAIFDAMQRRETYATTGPRMGVRFFGGWEFEDKDARNRMPASIGYAKGVPMGGDLGEVPQGRSPTFLAAALKDPIGANLDRIQIIKGWMDDKGELHEKVYDVAWSDNRKPDATTGKLPPVGSTVDVANATWTNTIGTPELIAVWKDPDFDPAARAFYYARVIEIPTPRWTCYDVGRFGVKMDANVSMVTQERAYTSPIWYTPEK
jgi:hypothetical protein